jgi:hypothetical protein
MVSHGGVIMDVVGVSRTKPICPHVWIKADTRCWRMLVWAVSCKHDSGI